MCVCVCVCGCYICVWWMKNIRGKKTEMNEN